MTDAYLYCGLSSCTGSQACNAVCKDRVCGETNEALVARGTQLLKSKDREHKVLVIQERVKWSTKAILNCRSLWQLECRSIEFIEATIKINHWAGVLTTSLAGEQSVALQKSTSQKHRLHNMALQLHDTPLRLHAATLKSR